MLIIRKTPRKKSELEIYLFNHTQKRYYLTLRREKNKLRPHRFRSSSDKLFPPRKAVELIRSEPVYISTDGETVSIKEDLEELLDYLQTSYTWVDMCRHCFIEGRVTTDPQYTFHGEKICKKCAVQEVKREIKFRNISIPVEPLLDRLKDVEKVLRLFDPKYKMEDTLYHVIEGGLPESLMSIDELDLPVKIKELFKKEVTTLLPIQKEAVESGLLTGQNLLIVSATASGKTLIAELAGLSTVYKSQKFLFLVPLVALANQKYEEFTKKYGSAYDVSIRVGMSRIKTDEDLLVVDTDIKADIIIGTYEGLDFLLRNNIDLGNIGCICIDEVHMLADTERGPRLDGMISRLRTLYPDAQFLGLSATIGNPEEIGKELGSKTILYEKRPVPLEQHIVLTPTKKESIQELVQKEWNHVSGVGYHGQSIVFTNSRRNCETLAQYLQSKRIKAQAYHAGLSYRKRKTVEMEFWNQNVQAVCCTAALSAGVDFPSSCVIFDSYKMGIEPLTHREFHQMMGRAGRPLYHEMGKAYLVIEPFSEEDELLQELLEGDMEEVDLVLTKEQELENALAVLACGLSMEQVNEYALWEIQSGVLDTLEVYGMVKHGEITDYGRAVSVSFLTVNQGEFIKRQILEEKDVLETVVKLESFNNVYVTQRLKSQLDIEADTLFSGACLEALSRSDAGLHVMVSFFVCDCKENPYCDHPKWNISQKICELRMKGLSPGRISKHFRQEYGLLLYPGDIFSYLDAVIHKIEALERIAQVFKKDAVKKAGKIKKKIEG
ncbi:MAG: DUF5814 domain-containing protein [Candidatus Methanofastidiosia archaeon]|jgi:helicase